MTITSLVVIGVIAFISNRAIYLDVAVVYGFLSFLGVIIVAKYIQGGL
jgi:multicomponent Na+:H+ antiporter subunit F